MDEKSVGWIAAIIIGGLAGWIASAFMKSDTGIFMNIVLGIIGAAVASFLFGLLGVSFGGWVGYLVAGIVGACILIWGARSVRSRG
ncbi:GlsB/YeaQ/YmgE family stress response membrane protein [Pseudogemmobacter faecipullorum]|uniref:GlsB/YeaQ/YmgE family stress response membrane protein n=1 Tax=Pseudogemmobacter faecipullorum TaxID=2755041 RepID=A0ABS8CN70_9RHOB|nr:GlsB/YeaQ/YmgE family stress response membrane protein [Pseudogemmobacter faecipullorum]MCB5410838.1 GlsB/YeaQ/YmgE family stress response membrane protein [Pseudogemmobacter faecipullorum]